MDLKENLNFNLGLDCEKILEEVKKGNIKEYYGIGDDNIIIKSIDGKDVSMIKVLSDIPKYNGKKQEYIVLYEIQFINGIRDLAICFKK